MKLEGSSEFQTRLSGKLGIGAEHNLMITLCPAASKTMSTDTTQEKGHNDPQFQNILLRGVTVLLTHQGSQDRQSDQGSQKSRPLHSDTVYAWLSLTLNQYMVVLCENIISPNSEFPELTTGDRDLNQIAAWETLYPSKTMLCNAPEIQ
jgi:hypothetical protein|mmetsp:Transcript_66472/g.111138  ORF Transcript_66472/g.111138 Transcript_66472/m.111138 type:complete len:149 (-) Transcript_66472:2139-2585(-)